MVILDVTFTDNSTGFKEFYPWPTYVIEFGDGDTFNGDRQYTGDNWFHQYDYAGTYTVNYTITQDSVDYTDTETITVGGALTNFYVQVGGLNTNPISGANVTIWYDGVYQDHYGTNVNGRSYFDVPSGRLVNGTVSKTGYQTASYSQYVSTWDTWSIVTLYTDNETPGSGDEYWNYIPTFRDASTNNLIYPTFINVYLDSGHTQLFTSEYTTTGTWTGLLPNNTPFYFSAEAGSYITKNWSKTLSGASVAENILMVPTNYGGLLPNLNIYVYSIYGAPISDAHIEVVPTDSYGTHTTNESGYAIHYCSLLAPGTSRSYAVTASKGGYTTGTGYINVSTGNPTLSIYLTPGAGATPTPTTAYTPVATPTWSGPGGTPGNIKEAVINFFMTIIGVSEFEARMLIGLLITLASAIAVGGALAGMGQGSSAGVGAMIGAVAGFVAASVIGFIPIWILVIAVLGMVAMFFVFKPGAGE